MRFDRSAGLFVTGAWLAIGGSALGCRDPKQSLGVAVSHETVPYTGVMHSLSLGQAALAAGLSLRTLKAFTEELKGTPYDLRASRPENPVRYDLERLSTWLHHRDRVRATPTETNDRPETHDVVPAPAVAL